MISDFYTFLGNGKSSTLMEIFHPWDSSPQIFENVKTKCIRSLPTFCDWLSFLLVSTLYSGWQVQASVVAV